MAGVAGEASRLVMAIWLPAPGAAAEGGAGPAFSPKVAGTAGEGEVVAAGAVPRRDGGVVDGERPSVGRGSSCGEIDGGGA